MNTPISQWLAKQKRMKKNFLLVDDDGMFLFLNTKVIELSGIDCMIKTASNGKEAMELVRRDYIDSTLLPDIIFIDLTMPVMNGFEFIKAFKAMDLPGKDKTLLVVVTSSLGEGDKVKVNDLGVNHFITKPLTVEDLIKLVDVT